MNQFVNTYITSNKKRLTLPPCYGCNITAVTIP